MELHLASLFFATSSLVLDGQDNLDFIVFKSAGMSNRTAALIWLLRLATGKCLLLPAASAADSETPFVCACPSDQPKKLRRAAQRAQVLILQSKPLIAFWNSLLNDGQMKGSYSNLDSNLSSAV